MGDKYRKRIKPSRDILMEKGLDIDDLIEVYEKEKSIARASKKIGISLTTFHKIMKKSGYVFSRGRKSFKKKHTSVVAEWLRKHNDLPLPRNYSKIAEIMDIPIATVRAYFKRRQERMQQVLKEHNDIISLPLFGMADVSGNMTTNKGFADTRIYVDDFALCYVCKAVTVSGHKKSFVIQFDKYLEMFGIGKDE